MKKNSPVEIGTIIEQSHANLSSRIGILFDVAPGKSRFVRNGIATLLLLLATLAHAQNSQFLFDGTGNLQAQTTETLALPQILGQPQMQIVIPGHTASFSVVVADRRGVSYQWLFNDSVI